MISKAYLRNWINVKILICNVLFISVNFLMPQPCKYEAKKILVIIFIDHMSLGAKGIIHHTGKTKIMFLFALLDKNRLNFFARHLETILENHFYNLMSSCLDQAYFKNISRNTLVILLFRIVGNFLESQLFISYVLFRYPHYVVRCFILMIEISKNFANSFINHLLWNYLLLAVFLQHIYF